MHCLEQLAGGPIPCHYLTLWAGAEGVLQASFLVEADQRLVLLHLPGRHVVLIALLSMA
jgi:hypothetical protein